MLSFIKQVYCRLLFTKANTIIKINKKRSITDEDLIKFDSNDLRAEKSSNYQELKITTPIHLIIQLLRSHKPILAWCFSLSCLRLICALSAPILIHALLVLLAQSNHTPLIFKKSIELAFMFSAISILGGIVINQCFYWDFTAFQMYQRLLNTYIYKKILAIKNSFHSKVNISTLVNLMGNDTHYLANLGYIINDSFFIITLFIGVISLLFVYLGPSALVTILSIIIFNPLAYLIMKCFGKSDVNQAILREQRISLLTQIIKGILTIKLLSIEKKSIAEIQEVRAKEIKALKNRAYISAFSFMVFGSVASFISFCTFAAHLYFGGKLDSATVFATLSLIALLEVPLSQLSDLISDSSSAYISAKRILAFLKSQVESSSQSTQQKYDDEILSHPPFGVNVNDLTVENILTNISLKILPGESTAIVGPVGSGKSSLLMCLLGETVTDTNSSIIYSPLLMANRPRIGYLGQEPFIINGTLRENILLGEHVSEEELALALYNCVLDKDILQFSEGLETKLGENGICLSGGQKQRLNLCRILLSKPGLVLLDDPFSAVDSHTKSLLFERLIFTAWKDTTCIIVTSSLDGLEQFDNIIYLASGKIIDKGTLSELLKNSDFQNFYSQINHTTKSKNETENYASSTASLWQNTTSETSQLLGQNECSIDKNHKSKAYSTYAKAMSGNENKLSWLISLALISFIIIATITPITQNIWLALWTNTNNINSTALTHASILANIRSNNFLSLIIYGCFILFSAFIIFCQRALWFRQAAIASQKIHDSALKKLMTAPLRFFDSTPAGVILAIFLRDLTIIEKDLRWTFENMARVSVQIITILVFMLASLPFIAILIGPILFFYYLTQRKFRKISREIKWVAQTNQASLNSHIKETFENISTIRVLGKKSYFEKKFFDRQKLFQEAAHTQEIIDRWFSTRVPLISGVISMIVSFTAVVASYSGKLSAGIAGLTFTYLIGFWTQLNWSVRAAALVEGNMASVDRLNCLAQLPTEETDNKSTFNQLNLQDIKGKIEFRNVSAKYAEHLPTILKNINFSVEPGGSLGIVGRTGAGKSTLIQAMLKLCNTSAGEILIDGVNIKQISLEKLREIISVIPQTPFIFRGSIRENIDPFRLHTDSDICAVLEKIGLSNFSDWLPNKLNTETDNNGQNLSQGQKQLLCIARALLRKPKIVIMDEITSNLDTNTELLIHQKLKIAWHGITKIIISHRQAAISSCDQILRLERGEVESHIVQNRKEDYIDLFNNTDPVQNVIS